MTDSISGCGGFGRARWAGVVALICATMSMTIAGSGQDKSAEKNEGDVVIQQEHALAHAEEQQDKSVFKKLLRNDLIFVAFNGWVFTKQDLVSKLQYIDVKRYRGENYKARFPAADLALITYDLTASADIAGHDVPGKQYVSSLWVRDAQGWQLLFHQSTPATHP